MFEATLPFSNGPDVTIGLFNLVSNQVDAQGHPTDRTLQIDALANLPIYSFVTLYAHGPLSGYDLPMYKYAEGLVELRRQYTMLPNTNYIGLLNALMGQFDDTYSENDRASIIAAMSISLILLSSFQTGRYLLPPAFLTAGS